MTRLYLPYIILFLLLGTGLAYCTVGTGLFSKEVYINDKGESLPYRFLKPQKLKRGQRYPLVIFFHGAGERGGDNEMQLRNGVQLFVKPENLKDYPCFMIVPQCPKDLKCVDTDWRLDAHAMPDTPSQPLRLSMELLDKIIRTYPIDTGRLYVTGVSMGGFATWDVLQRWPDKFAAAAPVCGGGDEKLAGRLKNTPVWAFHGAKDKLVKVIRSQHMVAAVQLSDGKAIYTEYPELGHNAWDSAYHDARILKWMFAQRK